MDWVLTGSLLVFLILAVHHNKYWSIAGPIIYILGHAVIAIKYKHFILHGFWSRDDFYGKDAVKYGWFLVSAIIICIIIISILLLV